MSTRTISETQIEQFNRDGYLFVPGMMSAGEARLLQNIAEADAARMKAAHSMPDSQGRASKLWFETKVHDDFYGAIVQWDRLVRPTEQLLGGPIYQWHHKLMVKEPRVGGAWEWHQDYGYWYHDTCLFPLLVSCMIAVNRASKENGCLQVLKGSHLMGRLDHGQVGGQTGANMERVTAAMKTLDVVHCEMEPGTALFFHCNTLHCSSPNTSDHPRWSLICCYNAMRNVPYRGGHGAPEQIESWSDDRVLGVGQRQLESLQTAQVG